MIWRSNRSILLQILRGLNIMALDLSKLTASVQAQTTVDGSVLALIQGMSAQITDLKNQVANGADTSAVQSQLDQLASQLDQAAQPLAAAVTANTPAQQT